MNLERKRLAQSLDESPASYAPIARVLTTISPEEMDRLKVKFDIAYFIAKENIAFTKYGKLCELEARHSVKIGTSYLTNNAAKDFIHFIAESMKNGVVAEVTKAKFFSIFLDGSTYKGNVDNELMMVCWCDTNGEDEKLHTRIGFLAIDRPTTTNAEGLYKSLMHGLQQLGIKEINKEECCRLIGIATDGALVNIASGGLKGLVEKQVPWVYWMWCMAHRLELAIKDALKGTSFDLVDEMLLRLYFIYDKSPKKCRELEGIVNDLKDCFQFDDDGVRPLRASGSRWVCHKLNAMRRVLSKYGAYTSHLATLSD